MNLIYLETFLTVYECGNFTKAAEKLFIPQPTVSNRIRYLEEELEQPLFLKEYKGKRSVQLTKAGQTFLPYARQILETMDYAKEEFKLSDPEDSIKIGSAVPLAHPLLIKQIKSLNSCNDDKNIYVYYLEPSHIKECIMKREIDIALTPVPLCGEEFNCYHLEDEDLELILSTKHHLASEKYISDINILQDEKVIDFQPYLIDRDPELVTANKKIVTNQLDIIKQLIISNSGISLLPSSLFQKEIEEGEIKSISMVKIQPFSKVQYYLVHSKNKPIYKSIFLSNKLKEESIS